MGHSTIAGPMKGKIRTWELDTEKKTEVLKNKVDGIHGYVTDQNPETWEFQMTFSFDNCGELKGFQIWVNAEKVDLDI